MNSSETVITLDIDWAPDFVIDSVADLLRQHRVKATWFVTHASPAVDRLRMHPELFELGIHPNFMAGSSHGETTESILRYCMQIVPEARSVRTHGLVQSSNLLHDMMKFTPLTTDVSLFLPGCTNLCPVDFRIGDRRLVRLPYVWEDDYELSQDTASWDILGMPPSNYYHIVDFHPMHIYLNSPSMHGYNACKGVGLCFQDLTEDICRRFIHWGVGAGSAFRKVVCSARARESLLIRDLYDLYVNSVNGSA